MSINILSIILLAFIVIKIADGYKKGMVKEIISFISLIIMCIVILLVSVGIHSYMEKEFVGILIAILLLAALGVAHHALKLVFFSAKLISKLPVIHWIDKLLGMAVGALEVILILWTVYTFIMYFEMGMIGNLIIEYSRDSAILTWLYENNMLAMVVEHAMNKL